jgi:hypothetical protein
VKRAAETLWVFTSTQQQQQLVPSTKNAIREVESPRKWQITDSDSTTEKGKPMGNKVSTGFLAPELVKMTKGRAVLRCLCVFDDGKRNSIAGVPAHPSDDILRKDEVALARESMDAWSFGCVAYRLITGVPLIGKLNVHDNLDEFVRMVVSRLECRLWCRSRCRLARWFGRRYRCGLGHRLRCRFLCASVVSRFGCPAMSG